MEEGKQVLVVSRDETRGRNIVNKLFGDSFSGEIIRANTIREACGVITKSSVDALVMDPQALVRAATVKVADEKFVPSKGNAKQDLMYVKRYIQKNCDRHMKLEELAQLISVSPNYLCHLFRQYEGTTVFEYMNQVRLERAAVLLRSTDSKVGDVAKKVGFAYPSYFCRKFHGRYGRTPKQYRLAHLIRRDGGGEKEEDGGKKE